jgi:hypothetical protein
MRTKITIIFESPGHQMFGSQGSFCDAVQSFTNCFMICSEV